jgi:beta-lactamase regulating signal transducer with metallopeptidase domain
MNLIDASIRAVLLAAMAAVFLAGARGRGKPITASFEHALWTCVLVGMLAFALPKITVNVGAPVRQAMPEFRAPAVMTVTPMDTKTVVIRNQEQVSWILLLWSCGAIGMSLRIALGAAIARRRFARSRRILGEAAVRSAMGEYKDVSTLVEECEEAAVPCAVGWPDARILLPVTWRDWPVQKVRAVLGHELAHVRRQDLLVKYLCAANQVIFWFHPLAWWLERRLGELAEFAADEAALSTVRDTHAYAEVLVEMAALARPLVSGPFAAPFATADFAQRGLARISRRVSRVLDSRPRSGPMKLIWAAGLLIAAVTLVRVERPLMAQVNKPQVKDSLYYVANVRGNMHLPPNVHLPFESDLTPEQAAAQEQKLAADPEDQKARVDLSVYYSNTNQPDQRLALVDWMIEHHPDSPVHSLMSMSVSPGRDGSVAYSGAVERWHAQLASHPNDANVLLNAAKTIGQSKFNEEIDLLKRAQSLDHDRFTGLLVQLYGETLAAGPLSHAEVLPTIRADLASSSDAALLGGTGAWMVERAVNTMSMHQPNYDWQSVRLMALDLLARAQSLDPANQKWPDAAEGARRMGETLTTPPASGAPLRIRVGGQVSKANLISAPEPQKNGVEGTVNLQVSIGLDGHVMQATLVSGPAALVQPAIAAVSQYIYKPTLLNGKPVEVQTTVEVVF